MSGSILPWWIAGSPCYGAVIFLWLQGVRGSFLAGVLWGSLGAAACAGFGSLLAPWLALPVLFFLHRKSAWGGGLAFYVLALALAFMLEAWGT